MELAQELIRELSLLKRPMEGRVTDKLLKPKGANTENVLVSCFVCNAILKDSIIELPLYMDTKTYFVLKFII